jgi:hypothetical protein
MPGHHLLCRRTNILLGRKTMKRLILMSMLVTSGLVVAACETDREEAVEEQQGIGGSGLREEPGEESLLEVEPREERGKGVLEPEPDSVEREGLEQQGVERERTLEND